MMHARAERVSNAGNRTLLRGAVAQPVTETAEAETVHDVLARGGLPLDGDTRAVMEKRFGRDFSRVRVHADSVAAESARAFDARAYTVGANLVFGNGMFQPGSEAGRRLLAHELAHALQQGMALRPPTKLRLAPTEDRAEREATKVGEQHFLESSQAPLRAGRCACGRPSVEPGGACAQCARRLRDRGTNGDAGASRILETNRIGIQRQQTRRQGPATVPAGGGHATAADWRVGAAAFNLILQHEFPLVNLSWYLGTRSDLPAGGNVQANLRSGRDGRVMFALSPDFEPAAQAELDRILAITTQLPGSAQFIGAGAAEFTAGGLRVRILPDTRAGSRNETSFRTVPNHVTTPGFSQTRGRVTAIIGPVPTPPVIEIFTHYAAQGARSAADPTTAPSAYGRGKTAADQAAGTTTLRFHESRHGEDFLNFIARTPYPTYTGSVRMTVAEFRRAGDNYLAAVRTWSQEMGRMSLCATDCVGPPNIDVFEHNTGRGMKCTTCRP